MRLLSLAAATSLLAAYAAGASAQRASDSASSIDWNALGDSAVQTLVDYIKVNTTNPPGNEMRGIQFLKGILEREGFAVRVLDTAELGATRGNLYARLEGSGKKKAIALVHHIDVVPASPSFWSVPPFSGEIKDGYVWGRGAIDMKGEGIAMLYAMLALKHSGVPLDRDIVFIANSDEELGSTGAVALVKNHPELLKDVEFLLTEGGDNEVQNGKVQFFGVGVAEKRTFWQRLTVHGVPSHGSRPTKLNPVPKLVAAVDKIAHYETPLHVTPGVQKFFHDIARTYSGEQRTWLSDVRAATRNPRARAWLTSNVYWNAILRNTISPTVLNASNKTNVIPPEATAEIDIRLLPDTDPERFLRTLQQLVGDTSVHFQTLLPPKTPLENPVDTDMFRAIERAVHDRYPDAIVTTPMLTAATDRPTYRALGIITYGFDPFLVEASDIQKGMHGNDERLSVENVRFGIEYLYDVLRYAQ